MARIRSNRDSDFYYGDDYANDDGQGEQQERQTSHFDSNRDGRR